MYKRIHYAYSHVVQPLTGKFTLGTNLEYRCSKKSDFQVLSKMKFCTRLHRFWGRMLDTKCVGDKMLVTVLAILVINIIYLIILVSGTNIQKMSPRS